MVRASEIGCRNGWNSDFWVPAGSAHFNEDDSMPPDAMVGSTGSDEMTSFAPFRIETEPADNRVQQTSETEDRVVGVSAAAGAPQTEQTRLASDCIQNPKEALRLARQQFRSKRQQTGRIADYTVGKPILGSDPDFAEMEDRVVSTSPQMVESPPAPEPVPYRVPPVRRKEIERTFPTITSFAEDADRFESVPSFEAPHAATNESQRQQRSSLEMAAQAVDVFDDESWEPASSPAPRRREPIVNRWFKRRRQQHWSEDEAASIEVFDSVSFADGYEETAPASLDSEPDQVRSYEMHQTIPVVQTRLPDNNPPLAARAADATVRQELPLPPRRSVVDRSDIPEASWSDDEYFVPPAMEAPLPQREARPPVEPRVEPHAAKGLLDDLPEWSSPAQPGHRTAPEAESIDQGPAIAPDIPRVCRTCRDFKPTGTGERGWCNNNHAFSHRRMVEADELACGSSYWCWWLPHDGIWQKDFDASRHAMPTPRVDRMLAATHRYARGEYQTSDEIRREG